MIKSLPSDEPTNTPARQYLPLLLVLFVVSGVCALVYEVVWFQLLQSVIGSTAVSLGLLLAAYMGGMCIGSLALPRFVPARHHPLRVYAALEAGIGVIGALALIVVPLVGRLYTAAAGPVFGSVFMRGVVCAICLLPPTILMGATLPAVARWITATPRGVSWMGLLYGANTVGAVIGGVLAGFYLLRLYDIGTATAVAALLNLAIAAIALQASRRAAPLLLSADAASRAGSPPARAWAVYIVIALSGAAALAAEVIWTRLLSLLLGATVYTFAMILAVFLSGLGVGSAVGAWVARRSRRPQQALALCQLLQIVGVGWAALMIAVVLPNWPLNADQVESAWLTMHLDLTRVLWAVFPASLLWGASFPLAIAAVAERGLDSGRLVGRIYAANTIGAIAGSLAFSLILIPALGTRVSHQLLVALSALAAVIAFLSRPRGASVGTGASTRATPESVRARRVSRSGAAAALGLAVLVGSQLPGVPGRLVAFGRRVAESHGDVDLLYVGEGVNSSIAISRVAPSGATQFHVAGRVEASTRPRDMRLQRMLGHLPAIIHGDPHSVLVVGFGAGITAGSLIVHPGIERMIVCEIEPLIPRITSQYFRAENHDVLRDRRVSLAYEDARSFLVSSSERFDVIASDPVHPRVRGAASLFTREYFETLRDHLNPGGVVSQWVPLDDSNAEAVKSEIATFFDVFPQGTVWAHHEQGTGLDLVLIGTREPARIDVAALGALYARADQWRVVASLREVGFASPSALLMTYVGHRDGLAPWLTGAAINRDRGLRLQYIAGLGGSRRQQERVYDDIVARRSIPESLFKADEAWMRQLRGAIQGYRP